MNGSPIYTILYSVCGSECKTSHQGVGLCTVGDATKSFNRHNEHNLQQYKD